MDFHLQVPELQHEDKGHLVSLKHLEIGFLQGKTEMLSLPPSAGNKDGKPDS